MSFCHQGRIHFHHTDAAGVVYFSHLLTLCHVAYEEALAAAGIPIREFFSAAGESIVPIVRAEIDFRRPLHCGDPYAIHVRPAFSTATQGQSQDQFTVGYLVESEGRRVAEAETEHVCLDPVTRQRRPISGKLLDWIQHHQP